MLADKAKFDDYSKSIDETFGQTEIYTHSKNAELFSGKYSPASRISTWIKIDGKEIPITKQSLWSISGIIDDSVNRFEIYCNGKELKSPYFNRPLEVSGMYFDDVFDVWTMRDPAEGDGYINVTSIHDVLKAIGKK